MPRVRPALALAVLVLAVLVLAVLVLAATPAGAQVAERLDDLRLATAVRIALVEDARTRPLDVVVTARGGAVRVEGPGSEAATVAEVARRVVGVRSVNGPVSDGPAAPPVVIGRPAPPAVTSPAPAPPGTDGGGVEDRPDRGGVLLHTVRRGDTLFSLARRYGTTVDEVLRLNEMASPSLRVGQRLRLR